MDSCPQSLADTARGNSHGGLGCAADSRYSFFALSEVPTAAQVTRICSSAACSQLLSSIKASVPTDCRTISSGLQLYAQILNPIEASCQASSSSSTAKVSAVHHRVRVSLIVGVVVGVCMAVGVVAFLGLLAFRWNRRKPQDRLRDTAMSVGSGAGESDSDGFPSPAASTAYYYLPEAEAMTSQGRPTGLWTDDSIQSARIPLEEIKLGVVLSRGAFGEVLRGSYNGQAVAIKRLLPGRHKNMKDINVFLQEASLMATLKHEHIVAFVGVAWDALSDLCIVTEFMDGGDLRSLLETYHEAKRPTGFDANKLRIATHTAHALTYLHSLQPCVVHRDLKSKNIMLSHNLDAKLTDFGASRAWRDGKMTAAVGSSLWMAPEVMMGDHYDEKADVFSFGVLLSEIDTHELPYSHAHAKGTSHKLPEMTILQMVSMGALTVAFSERADARVVGIARACVAVEPQDRPSASEVLLSLQQLERA